MFLLHSSLIIHTSISGSGVGSETIFLVAKFLLGNFFATVKFFFSRLLIASGRCFFKIPPYCSNQVRDGLGFVGLPLFMGVKRFGVKFKLFFIKKKNKRNAAGAAFLIVLFSLNTYFEWF